MERIVARDQNRVQETSEEKLSSLLPLSGSLSIATRDNCKRQEGDSRTIVNVKKEKKETRGQL
jgi:hypothetical protein